MNTLAVIPLLTLLAAPTADLQLAPAAGTRLTKTFAMQTSLEGGELEVIMDGMEIPAEFLPVLELSMTSSSEMVFTDRYLAVQDGRVTGLARTFDDLEDVHESTESMEGQGFEATSSKNTTTGRSELEGESVRFTWDAEEGAYDAEFERGEGEGAGDGLLEGLAAPLDLTGFLPPKDAGDSWTVSAEVLAELVSPGGNLHFLYSGDDAERFGSEEARTSFDGELEVIRRGEHSRDGVDLIELEIEGEVTVVIESPTDLDDIPVVDGTGLQTFTQTITLEGALRWNASANHLHSLELEGEVEATMQIEKDAESAGPSFKSTIHLAGETSIKVGFEAAK
ncbi:MAG: hypothetical protein O2816_04820 [Planctomycetota bacterium]|nr:hypothetical protein [Planctomycetota bacterium]